MNYNRVIQLKLNGNVERILPINDYPIIDANYMRIKHTPELSNNGLNDWSIVIEELPENVLGECDYNQKLITISPIVCYICNFKQAKNIVLHEVAHALCPNEGHNEIWQAKAIEIGCTGNVKQNIKSITPVEGGFKIILE